MDGLHEEVDSTPVDKSFIQTEDTGNERSDELTSTPLKKYVTYIENKKDKWICNFGCKAEPYTGTYSRIRAHLIGLLPGQKAQGVALCSKVNNKERETMTNEEAGAKKVIGDNKKALIYVIPNVPPMENSNACKRTGSRDVVDMFDMKSRSDVDEIIASYYYANGIPVNVTRSPFWFDMVRAINEAPRGYKPPSAEKIRTVLLDKEKNKIDKAMRPIKDQWPTYGVSIVSDGWTNIKNQTLVNVMAISGGKAMFISGVDCLEDEKSGAYIAAVLLKAIKHVGVYNVVQVLTDSDSTCKNAGSIIEARHPHIYWSGCMAHTLSLILKDITRSKSPALVFVGQVYEQAKAIVKYMKNHSSALHILQAFSALEVFQAKKTRFGSNYLVLERVVRVKNTLISMVVSEEWEKIKKGHSYVDHDIVKKIVLDDDFWNKAKYILSFMKPIYLMIRFCDSDKGVIGEVYQRMGDMLDIIKVSLVDLSVVYSAVKAIIMARWEKRNFHLHSLAFVLSPYYYSHSWLRSLSPGGETRKKPHADSDIDAVYLDVVDRIVIDPKERSVIRHQLSDFFANRGTFSRPQAIEDRETMPALSWWELYGVAVPELYSLSVKVLSQSVTTSYVERAWSSCNYIRSVKRNKVNDDRAKSLVYVHYNHRLLSRYRDDYEETYKNWDAYVDDDNLELDIESIEDREFSLFHDEVACSSCAPFLPSQGLVSSSSTLEQTHVETSRGKRPRMD